MFKYDALDKMYKILTRIQKGWNWSFNDDHIKSNKRLVINERFFFINSSPDLIYDLVILLVC